MSKHNVLIYLFRKDLRISDNPVLHRLEATANHGFTLLLPLYIFTPRNIEVSGFIRDGSPSPFPEARSDVGGYWRCGPHRASFIAQSVWDLKTSLEKVGSGLELRVGTYADTLSQLIKRLKDAEQPVGAVWMTDEEGVEEKRDQRDIAAVCAENGAGFKVWADEKYYIDE